MSGARRLLVLGLLLGVAACDRCGSASATDAAAPSSNVPVPVPDAASASAPASASATASASAPASASGSASGSASSALPLGDGGAPCPILQGPEQLPFTGPAALAAGGDGVDVVFFAGGAPKVVHRATPKAGGGAKEVPVASAAVATEPACAVAGTFAFCMNPDGAVTRTRLAGGSATNVGKAKPGTRIAAASAGGETVVAFLAERRTSEGVTSEAWIVGGATPLTRISDDGAGATFVALAPSGADALVALYVDGRRGMAPIHGVRLSVHGGKVARDGDDVLYVAGGAETYTGGALATASDGRAFALVPIAHDVGFGLLVTRFGVASDEHWSDYANGLDPAPIAATAMGTGDPWAFRVKPSAAKFGSPRVLELGRVTNAGFVASGIVATHGDPRAVATALDPGGALSVVFTDAAGTWLERLRCP